MKSDIKTKVVTGKVRFCYVNIFSPRAVVLGAVPKYSLCILIPKNDEETLEKIRYAIEMARKKGEEIFKDVPCENLRFPLLDGDDKALENNEFYGNFYINASTKFKPGIVDKDLNSITDPEQVYSGCYGRVSLNFYPYRQEDKAGIGCCLLNVQKLEDGERLCQISSIEDDFMEVKGVDKNIFD